MGSSGQNTHGLPPLSVEQIAKRALDYDFDPLVPLRYWLRSANSLSKEATIYEREGNDQQAYLLLFRQSQLFLNHILRHPDAATQSNRRALTEVQREVNVSLSKLEQLKPRIEKHYKQHVRTLWDKDKQDATALQPVKNSTTSSSEANEMLDPALAGGAKPLAAAENKDLAVKLAQKELRRRATGKLAPSTDGSAAGLRVQEDAWVPPSKPVQSGQGRNLREDLSVRLQEVMSNVAGDHSRPSHPGSIQTAVQTRNETEYNRQTFPGIDDQRPVAGYQYPHVPTNADSDLGNAPPPIPIKEPHSPPALIPPPLPPRVPEKVLNIPSPASTHTPQQQQPPPLPSKVPQLPATPENGHLIESKSSPSPDLHPSVFTFKPSSYLENGTPLRTIFISPQLRKQFLSVAATNTSRNLETCGILCGTLISNAFFISRLVIPEQESTSDTCEMVNEAAVFEYCDAEDLMVLGWIHTHPSQTCFMSSRDLHTHSGFQVMLAESIAIVCAPTKTPDWGIFRLTDPPGLKTVLSCTQTGLFHPHAEDSIYTDALRPGHVFEAKGLEFEMIDMRNNSR